MLRKWLTSVRVASIYILHGAFKTGIQATTWKLHGILKSAYYLFNESPARFVFFLTSHYVLYYVCSDKISHGDQTIYFLLNCIVFA